MRALLEIHHRCRRVRPAPHHLRALRKRLADENGLPPYVVFHDVTLREMAARRPLTLNQFAELPGVGRAKLERYGDQFIAAMREHAARSV